MGGGTDFFARVKERAGTPAFLDALKWDEDGRVVIVAQDARNKEVLCVAFANRIALEKTLKTGLMHYYSRSRNKLWKKGETSGHFQKLVELSVDCDGDALVAKVHQVKASCHLGFRSCFSYKVSRNKSGALIVKQTGKQVFDPEKVYTAERRGPGAVGRGSGTK
jgi:phosphoribosyl-AMP cyclohydrolase